MLYDFLVWCVFFYCSANSWTSKISYTLLPALCLSVMCFPKLLELLSLVALNKNIFLSGPPYALMCFLVIFWFVTFSIISCNKNINPFLPSLCLDVLYIFCLNLFLALVTRKNTTLSCWPCAWMFCVFLIWLSSSKKFMSVVALTKHLPCALKSGIFF